MENSIQVTIRDARIREYGVGHGDSVEALEITISGDEDALQRFTIDHLGKMIAVMFADEVIAAMTLRSSLRSGPLETKDWKFLISDDPDFLAARMRSEGRPLRFVAMSSASVE
jgi:hypothetical protein